MNRQEIIDLFQKNYIAQRIGLCSANCLLLNSCLDNWEQPHRYYHNMNHLSFLLEQIRSPSPKKELLEILSLFHDVIYDPHFSNNEIDSIAFLQSSSLLDTKNPYVEQIFDSIRDTAYEGKEFLNPDLSSIFCSAAMDLHSLRSIYPTEIRNTEIALLKEFQFMNYPNYRQKRLDFLQNFKKKLGKNSEIKKEFGYPPISGNMIDFITNYKPKIAVYAGSFNPFHLGHMDILEQAEKIFDKVIIACGVNSEKKESINIRNADKVLPFHEVICYDCLLTDLIKKIDYADVTLIRGLRSGYDLEYEMNQLRTLRDMNMTIPVIYFFCNKDTAHISSSMIRGLTTFKNANFRQYIPNKFDYAKKIGGNS